MSTFHAPSAADRGPRATLARLCCALILSTAWLPSAPAGATEISDQPLIHAQGSKQPNLMFVLDNSGSMARDYMPENTGDRALYSVWSWHCNGAAFNPSPNVTDIYKLPKTHDGRDYPQMAIGAAWDDGFQIDLNAVTNYAVTASVNTGSLADGNAVSATFIINAKPFVLNDVVVMVDPNDTTHWVTGKVTSYSTRTSGSGKNRVTQTTYTVNLTFSSFRNGTVASWSVAKPNTIDLLSTGNTPATHYFYKHSSDSETASTEPTRPWKYTTGGSLDTSDSFVSECLSATYPGISAFTQKLVSNLDTAGQSRYANWYSYYRTRILMMRSSAGLAMNDVESRFRVGFSALNKNGSFNTDVSDNLGSFASVNAFDEAQRRTFFSNLYGAPVGGTTPLRGALAKIGQYYGNRLTGQTDPSISACQRNYSVVTTDGYWNDATRPTKLDGTATIDNQDGDASLTPRPEYDGSSNYTAVEQRTNYDFTSNTGCSSGKKKYTPFSETRTATTTPAGTTYSAWARVSGSEGSVTCRSSAPSPGSPVQVSTTGGPAPNTLADVAEYYYKTDLRNDLANNVVSSANDPNKFQHMVTFTLGLGLSGQLAYKPNYQAGGSGGSADYNAIVAGTANWPIPPLDTSDHPAKIDDLWHAAVNGHGRYFSASSSSVLTSSLQTAINDINAETGAGSSAASTSLRPVLGTDQVFVAKYQTVLWNGELLSYTITTQGEGDAQKVTLTAKTGIDWTASDHLSSRTPDSRNIYYMRHATASTYTMGNFKWTDLSSDQDSGTLTGYFNNFCSKTHKPTQCDHLATADRTSASGENLIKFLRGDATYEDTLYRSRYDANNKKHNVLGDMVDASPVYVGKPPFSYTGQDYPAWKASMATRCPVVYAAANDGMLHAFSARTATSASSCVTAGQELWAYIPRAVMPELYRLADSNYAARHIFTVNGSPVVADVSVADGDNRVWSSILVGGLGAGGKAYYALDVTDPASPKPLWEFSDSTDADLGLTFGNPIVTQVHNQNNELVWAVVFTSGMNNSGNGYLYVLEALTGHLMYKVPTLLNGRTAVGTSSDPSGLNKLNAWVVTPSDNEAQYFYGVDLKGNVWRFDANNLTAPTTAGAPDTRAVRLAELKKNGVAQAITVKPELAEVKDDSGTAHKVVLVGAGQYLGSADSQDFSTPWSVYAIKDPLASTGWSDARGSMVAQTLSEVKTRSERDTNGNITSTVSYRELSKNTVDWSSSTMSGWYVDLPVAGERVAVGMNLAYSTLTVASLVPKTGDDCNNGGESWLYDFNIKDGSYVDAPSIPMIGGYKSDSAVMGINTLQYEGRDKSGQIITHSDGSTSTRDHVKAPSTSGSARRTAWRELTQ